MKLYGIPDCNTVKRARDRFFQHRIDVEFHDFKKHGLDSATAQSWLQQTGRLLHAGFDESVYSTIFNLHP